MKKHSVGYYGNNQKVQTPVEEVIIIIDSIIDEILHFLNFKELNKNNSMSKIMKKFSSEADISNEMRDAALKITKFRMNFINDQSIFKNSTLVEIISLISSKVKMV